jgi:hypothetical protein
MGVTFSEEDVAFKGGTIDRNILRLDQAAIEAAVVSFVHHSFPPVGSKDELLSIFRCAVLLFDNVLNSFKLYSYQISLGAKIDTILLLDTCWQMFQENDM